MIISDKNGFEEISDNVATVNTLRSVINKENEIMQYLTKQELMLINQEWQEEYEQKDIRL